MADDKSSILLSDVSVEWDLVEKDKIIIDAKVNGDIKAEEIETHQSSNISGNIDSKNASRSFSASKAAVLSVLLLILYGLVNLFESFQHLNEPKCYSKINACYKFDGD